jgi:hypothetical protein
MLFATAQCASRPLRHARGIVPTALEGLTCGTMFAPRLDRYFTHARLMRVALQVVAPLEKPTIRAMSEELHSREPFARAGETHGVRSLVR